ncbi:MULTISPECIES: TraR/DksA C4-type zinc finger protein [unclassified Brevibacterium]|uniref:TraR/DksA C4-type zinc finger protein n=1 Tax=unclassified Brevibacterium TaxID=2614124 RepID=UPI0032C3E7EF
MLGEPTNRLDVDDIAWLARLLLYRWPKNSGTLVLVTHDRWFRHRHGIRVMCMADDQWLERLRQEEAETRALLASLSASIDSLSAARQGDNSDDEHDPEGATIAFERSQADAMRQQARERLDAIAAAVTRLDDGTFGICAACSQPIAQARLDARPSAALCVTCASRDTGR